MEPSAKSSDVRCTWGIMSQKGAIIEFTHPDLGQEVPARAGYYTPLEEHVLPYKGREVLCILGHACIETSCCGGTGSWAYIQVPGFLVRKHVRGGGTTHPISEIEIIEDEEARNSIRESLMRKHSVSQVDIWTSAYAPSPVGK